MVSNMLEPDTLLAPRIFRFFVGGSCRLTSDQDRSKEYGSSQRVLEWSGCENATNRHTCSIGASRRQVGEPSGSEDEMIRLIFLRAVESEDYKEEQVGFQICSRKSNIHCITSASNQL